MEMTAAIPNITRALTMAVFTEGKRRKVGIVFAGVRPGQGPERTTGEEAAQGDQAMRSSTVPSSTPSPGLA